MSTCGKCASVIVDTKLEALCAQCDQVFHPTCSRLGSDINFKKLNNQQKIALVCDVCGDKSTSSKINMDYSDLIKTIKNLDKNLSGQIGQVNNNIEDVKVQLQGVNNTIESMKTTLSF